MILSVGGATFRFPSSRMSQDKIEGILKFVDQYDLDGIDLDYKNDNPGCQLEGSEPKCTTDENLTNLIEDFGNAVKSFNT